MTGNIDLALASLFAVPPELGIKIFSVLTVQTRSFNCFRIPEQPHFCICTKNVYIPRQRSPDYKLIFSPAYSTKMYSFQSLSFLCSGCICITLCAFIITKWKTYQYTFANLWDVGLQALELSQTRVRLCLLFCKCFLKYSKYYYTLTFC